MHILKYLLTFVLLAGIMACSSIDDNFPVPEASLVAKFNYQILDADTRQVQFNNGSVIPSRISSVSYTWSFGDGNFSSEESPIHTYASYGDFEVKLVIIAASEIKETEVVLPLLQPIDIDFTLYYMDVDQQKIHALGTDNLSFVTGGFGNGLAIDTINNKLYFVDDDNKAIKRSNLDGSNIESIFTGISGAQSLALDVAGGKVYWTSRANATVNRGNLDGSGGAEVIISSGLSLPEGIAVFNGKVYVSDVQAPPIGERIMVANTNGSNLEVFINGSWGYALAIDPVNQRLYFDDQADYDNPDDNRIKSASLLNPTDIITVGSLDAVTANGSRSFGIAVKPSEGKVYWNDTRARKIKRANFNGSAEETILITAGSPRGLALGK